ncbi:MAG: hypothetical protein HFH24_09300 [Ruminococcus sp.]|nr:hypothetical protein [Ruminococcus sp.]
MEYQEFVCAVEERMNQLMEGGRKASQYTVIKNNGTMKTGIVLETPGVNVSPTIYLEEFYQGYLDGKPFAQIVEEIFRFYHKIKCEESWNLSKIESYDRIRDRIVFKMIHTERNEALLEMLPHLEWLDLSIVFYALLDVDRQGTATMTISEGHLQHWKVTKEELFRVACDNVKRLLPAELYTMQRTMEDILCFSSGKRQNLLEERTEGEKDWMYVLSNSIRSFGAACIVYPEVLELAAQVLKGDYYILPSSVHEVVLVPVSRGMEQEEMNEMVREINATQLEEEEILSDHVYIYKKEEGKVVM